MKRALISVFHKTGVDEIAALLTARGWEIISTGGTAKFLKEKGIAVRDIKEITGFPEILDGRVKTLHPLIFGTRPGQEDARTISGNWRNCRPKNSTW